MYAVSRLAKPDAGARSSSSDNHPLVLDRMTWGKEDQMRILTDPLTVCHVVDHVARLR